MIKFIQVKPMPDNVVDIHIIINSKKAQAKRYMGKSIIYKFTDKIVKGRISKIKDIGYCKCELIVEKVKISVK